MNSGLQNKQNFSLNVCSQTLREIFTSEIIYAKL